MTGTTFKSFDGEGYELQMGRWSRRLAPLFVEFAGIHCGNRVLDVGCGTGNLSFCLSRSQAIRSVHGIDLSLAYVEHAKRHAHDERTRFQVADACFLPFSDAAFDHAASLLVLQFIPQPELAVREMRRVTRPGGTVAAATWDTGGGFVAYRMVFDTAALLSPDGATVRAQAYGRRMRRPGELCRAWRDAGLVDVTEGTLTIRMDFASFADFWAPADSHEGPVAAYVKTLDEHARTSLRHMVELAYCEGQPDGPRSFAATAWVVKGKVPCSPLRARRTFAGTKGHMSALESDSMSSVAEARSLRKGRWAAAMSAPGPNRRFIATQHASGTGGKPDPL